MFDELRQEMNSLMEQFFAPEADGREQRWFALRTNLVESDKEFEVTIDLPGMKAEDFNIEIREGNLWITGERKCESLSEGKVFRRVGRSYGRFEEVIPLDSPVKEDQVRAEYKDGVLHLVVPKAESAKPRKIEVKSA
jgi:HSP20 family protein